MRRDRLQLTIDAVRLQLVQAVRWRLAWRAATAIGVAFWVGLAVDRTWEPSPRGRLVFCVLAAIGAIAWSVREAWPLLRRKYSDAEIAQLIATRLPKGADPLLTAVDAPSADSPQAAALAEATRAVANTVLAKQGPLRIVRPTVESGWPWLAVVLLGSALLLAVVRPASFACYGRRMALSAEAWPRAVRLLPEGFEYESASGDWIRKVARGEPYEIRLKADLSDGHRSPGTVRYHARWTTGERLSGTFIRIGESKQEYRLLLEATTSNALLRVAGGDCHLRLRLEAITPPAIINAGLRITPPSYLQMPAYEATASAMGPLPEGARIQLLLTTSKPLARATAQWVQEAAEPALSIAATIDEKEKGIKIDLPLIKSTGELVVSFFDTDGIASVEPHLLLLDILPDEPPTVELRPVGVVRTITRNARIPFHVSAKDDHGIGTMELLVERDEKPWHSMLLYAEASHAPDGSVVIDQQEIDLLSLRSSGKEVKVGQRLTLRANVTDRYDLGSFHNATSEPITLRVVTPEEILARIGETERALRETLEGTLSDARRLAYALAHQASPSASSNQLLDTRKVLRSLQSVAASFATLRDEVINNRLDQPVMVKRLTSDILAPLRSIVREELRPLEAFLESPTAEKGSEASSLATRTVKNIERVLDHLERRESYNEVVALLRGLIREQRRVNDKTESERRTRARRSLLD